MGHKVDNSVELLWLQKAAGFGHLEDTKLGQDGKVRRWGNAGCRGAGSACVQRTMVRGSKAMGGISRAGKTYLLACVCIYPPESPWDSFTVVTVCSIGWGLYRVTVDWLVG